MKEMLIISFDLIREGEPNTSLSIGSLLATLNRHEAYGTKFRSVHHSVNLQDESTTREGLALLKQLSFGRYDWIAVSAYIWGEKWMKEFLNYLRFEIRYKGIIILGGYQVSYGNDEQLIREYPEADVFVKGFAEQGLLDIIQSSLAGGQSPKFITSSINMAYLPSPYLEGAIALIDNQRMVRMEAKRGCPYQCSFCAHKDNLGSSLHEAGLERLTAELDLMKAKHVGKINFLDPVFNMRSDYLEVLNYLQTIRFEGEVSLQARPERISGKKGEEFLRMLNPLNATLEFGIQTLDNSVNELIYRKNVYPQIFETISNVLNAGVNFEVSLIYGLPGQTLSSFQNDIETLQKLGVKNITAWPLMLLKGTLLYTQKEEFGLKEDVLGRFHIPHVVQSSTFTDKEWRQMHEIAVSLNPNSRVF